MKVVLALGVLFGTISLAFSIHEKDLTECMAWGVILMYNIKELITMK